MAIIKCPECGQDISDKAKKCIHCGKVFVEEGIGKVFVVCAECGAELAETDEYCPNCGCPVSKNNPVQKKSKRTPVIIITIVGVIIVFSIIGFLVIKMNANPVQKYIRLFNGNKSEEAMSLYNEKIEGNTELINVLEKQLNLEMDDIYKQYSRKKLSYEESIKKLENYLINEPSNDYARSIKQKLDDLNHSRIAYTNAVEAEKSGDISTALKNYIEVIKEDESYTDAQTKIKSLTDTYKSQLLAEAENYSQNKQNTKAIETIEQIISVLGSSEDLEELIEKYTNLKSEEYVKVVVEDKSETPMDSSNWIFNNYANFVFLITNNSDKTVVGVEGVLTVNDLFGKKILSMGCDFTGNTIDPGASYRESELSYECNQFIDDDMKLFNTRFEDLQFIYEVTSIVFSDGSSIEP